MKPTVVLCDLNLGDRGRIVGNIVLACRIAADLGATVVGWVAIPGLFRKRGWTSEIEDLHCIASHFGVRATYVRPRIILTPKKWDFLLIASRMLVASLAFPKSLSRMSFSGVPLGRQACDSQRRRTLSLVATPVVWSSRPGENIYPWTRLSKSRVRNLLALPLVRFAVRSWINYMFWSRFLSEHNVVFSVQSHTERAEFGPLTSLLQQREVPILIHLEKLLARDENLQRIVRLGQVWLSELPTSTRLQMRKNAISKLHQSFFDDSTDQRIHAVTAKRDILLDQQLRDQICLMLKNNRRLIVIVLPATYEAFNHDSLNQVFSNYFDWSAAVLRVARAASCGVLFKAHPHGDPDEVRRIWEFVRRFDEQKVEIGIAPQGVGTFPLAEFRRKIVATCLSSSAILELAFLGIPVVPATQSAYTWWSFAEAPRDVSHYEARLMDALRSWHQANMDEVSEALLVTNYHKNWREPLSVLVPGVPTDDLNPKVHARAGEYESSTMGLTLTTGALDKAFSHCSDWSDFVSGYRPPIF